MSHHDSHSNKIEKIQINFKIPRLQLRRDRKTIRFGTHFSTHRYVLIIGVFLVCGDGGYGEGVDE